MSETHETPEFQQGQVSDVENLLGAAADRAARASPAASGEHVAVTEAAAEELSAWAEELRPRAGRAGDPRNWVSRRRGGGGHGRGRRPAADRGSAAAPAGSRR